MFSFVFFKEKREKRGGVYNQEIDEIQKLVEINKIEKKREQKSESLGSSTSSCKAANSKSNVVFLYFTKFSAKKTKTFISCLQRTFDLRFFSF